MQAVILAGGLGTRLERVAGGRPKCLLEIGGRPLILHQLEALSDHGVGPVLMVVGYNHEAIRTAVGERVEYLFNEQFRETNSLYSLWLAREWIKGPFLLLNSDLFFDPEILARLLEEPGNVLAYDSTSSRGREQTKVAIRGRRVVDLGKDLPPASARGESLGLLKFDSAGAKALLDVTNELIAAGDHQAWVIEATRAVCRVVPLYGVNIASLRWTEVDFPHDLEEARSEIWPAISRSRRQRRLHWRGMRWMAAVFTAVVIASGAWLASARVGPASIDWENVAPTGQAPVSLSLPSTPQRWWLVARGDSLVAHVEGGTPLRLEFRLLLAARPDTGRYVVAIAVDNAPHDWEAFTAAPDSGVTLDGAPVGDRDRLEFTLPPGPHTVKVELVAGHSDRMLVRIRRPG